MPAMAWLFFWGVGRFFIAFCTGMLYHMAMVPSVISYSHARQNLAKVMQDCVDDSLPFIIAGRKRKVVMMPYDDWVADQESRHLLESPSNAAHLRESMKQIERGEVASFSSVEDLKAFVEHED